MRIHSPPAPQLFGAFLDVAFAQQPTAVRALVRARQLALRTPSGSRVVRAGEWIQPGDVLHVALRVEYWETYRVRFYE